MESLGFRVNQWLFQALLANLDASVVVAGLTV